MVIPYDNLYLLTALPAIGDLGSLPPMTLPALAEHVAHSSAEPLVRAVLLADDLLLRQAVLAGETVERPEPAVLTPEQVVGSEPLPEQLGDPAEHGGLRLASDLLWERYYRYLARVSRRHGSRLLGHWVRFEVGLRNELARSRATVLQLDPRPYLVAPELAEGGLQLEALLHDWSTAADPLAGTRLLDEARWRWLADHEPLYSFSDDELVIYAERLLLLVRYARLERREATLPAWQPGGRQAPARHG